MAVVDRDGLRKARAVPVPDESNCTNLYTGASLADAYAIDLPAGCTHDIRVLSKFVMGGAQPAWVKSLMATRDGMVSVFGIKTSAQIRAEKRSSGAPIIDFFPVLGTYPDEVIVGENDRHLDFRSSLLRRPSGNGTELVLTTVVHCHNLLGRAYLAAILPFHRVIVRSMLERAARRGWPRDREKSYG